MISYQHFYDYLHDSPLENWLETLPPLVEDMFDPKKNGHLEKWLETLTILPKVTPSTINLSAGTIQICTQDIVPEELEALLRHFIPWRKGPYDLFGIHIDTEWRSDWKWKRLEQHIQPLHHRLILDVGCGNGYHCLRMLGAGAERVIGIDPGMLSVMQFHVIKQYTGQLPMDVLPLGIEQIPAKPRAFDTVFSMGILYHRRSPVDHLQALADCLKPGGELVLETLVIEGDEGQVLMPEARYAQMRNVWFLPSCPTLKTWLRRCGFSDIQLIDISKTTVNEQRTTDWMPYHSLSHFLDQDNPDLTCEGLPAPIRATFTARIS